MHSVPFQRHFSCTKCPVNKDCLCKPLTDLELDSLQSFKKVERIYKKNEIIFQNNSKLNEVMTVISGWTIEYKIMPDGKRSISNISIPGDFIGFTPENNFLNLSSLSAVTEVKVCVFDKDSLNNFVKKHPEMASRLITMLSYEVNKLSNLLTSISRLSANEKLLYLIQSLSMKINKCSFSDLLNKKVYIPLSQEQIADILGMTSVHLSRTMKNLKDKNILEIENKDYKLLALRELN